MKNRNIVHIIMLYMLSIMSSIQSMQDHIIPDNLPGFVESDRSNSSSSTSSSTSKESSRISDTCNANIANPLFPVSLRRHLHAVYDGNIDLIDPSFIPHIIHRDSPSPSSTSTETLSYSNRTTPDFSRDESSEHILEHVYRNESSEIIDGAADSLEICNFLHKGSQNLIFLRSMLFELADADKQKEHEEAVLKQVREAQERGVADFWEAVKAKQNLRRK